MIQQIGSEEQESNTRKDVANHTNLELYSTGPDTSQLFGMRPHESNWWMELCKDEIQDYMDKVWCSSASDFFNSTSTFSYKYMPTMCYILKRRKVLSTDEWKGQTLQWTDKSTKMVVTAVI